MYRWDGCWGVEELPQEGPQSTPQADASATAPEETAGELTEAQLQMVEEIVERYTAALGDCIFAVSRPLKG